jgi:uncharacterized RDD family membrane protein YckC
MASVLYDSLLILAILMVASAVFISLFGDATKPPLKLFYQLYLLLVSIAYFVGFWVRGGQTLAMKTWRFKLVGPADLPITFFRGLLRFLLAPLGLLLFWYAWLDKERCFLHDRLVGTRLVMVDNTPVEKTA